MEILNHETIGSVPSQYKEILAGSSFNFDLLSIVRAMFGIAVLIFIAWLFSSNRKAISWNTVIKGLILQIVIALSVMFIAPVQEFFNFFGYCFIAILGWTKAGSDFLFGAFLDVNKFGYVFAFQILPTIIFFSAFTSLLFYLGILQQIVRLFAWLMSRLIKLSGAESLATVANIFVGMNEAPLVVKPYISKMTKSELMLVMTAGMSTMAGGVLAAYIGMLGNGIPELELQFARHLLAASVMAAPGAIVISKILVPQTVAVERNVEISKDKLGTNILESISIGTTDGLKLAGNVAAMLLVFYALIAGGNSIISFLGSFDLYPATIFCLAVIIGLIYHATFLFRSDKIIAKYILYAEGLVFAFEIVYIYMTNRYNGTDIFSMEYFDSFGTYLGSSFIAFGGIFLGSLISHIYVRRNKPVVILYSVVGFVIPAAIFTVIFFINFRNPLYGITSINSIIADFTAGQYSGLSMQFILGYVFAPVIWLIGVCTQDVSLVGELLGQKIILTEFVGYNELSNMLSANSFSEIKSAIMATYVLCGFANFASVGIQIGGIGSIAPNQRSTLSVFGMRALLGGTLSALISAAIVGMMM
ncbi:MAG: Na+ dependent nucleoside transporter [Prevotellaceae bacterium]|jgi:nucleoside transporter|nr:Na+ dependent nucleoside transporter [Prevotellaceae bacterium]